MKTRKPSDKFKVGDLVTFNFTEQINKAAGWSHLNGEIAEIIGGKVYGEWKCGSPDGKTLACTMVSWRYKVESASGTFDVQESQLKPLYKPGHVASWETCAWRPTEKGLYRARLNAVVSEAIGDVSAKRRGRSAA